MKGNEIGVSEPWKDNYDSYYSPSPDLRKWRDIGAKYKADNIVALCSAVSHGRILDIGAGDGAVSAVLAERCFGDELYCLEISSSGVEAIRKRNIPGMISADRFDGYHIAYPDRFFDLCIASHVLEHIEHERVFLRESARVCKHLFIEVPLEDTVRLVKDYSYSAVGHINFYNYKTIRSVLQTTDLTVLDHRLFDTPLEILQFQSKAIGLLKFLVRRVAAVFPQYGSRVFTYHSALLLRCVPRYPGGNE